MGNDSSKPMSAAEKHRKLTKYVENLEKDDIDDSIEDSIEHEFKEKENIDACDSASVADPQELRRIYKERCLPLSSLDSAALDINPYEWEYPFESIVMEGGGNKGLAYCGAVKCLEEIGLMKQIKRIGGTSAGALTAGLIAVGYSAEDVLFFLSDDLESVFLDHTCGYFSLLPNLVRKFGWNPGNKIMDWFGKAIERKTGNPDTTFYELYQQTGVELCVVVTNLNLMTAEYCHPKTTPDMPIRIGLRMTMAIPGMFSALKFDKHGQTDVFVDGGLVANYPINCFDGWYLSMDREDAFLRKLKPLSQLPQLMSTNNRFKPRGENKTIGFLLFDEGEQEVMRFNLEKRVGAIQPKKPTKATKLFKLKEVRKKTKEKCEKAHAKIVKAVEAFFAVLHEHNIDDEEFISKDELKKALEDEKFSDKHRELLFGKQVNFHEAFDILDRDRNDKIAFRELIQFIEERGIRMQVRFQGYDRRPVDNFGNFLMALSDTMLTNLKFVSVRQEDEDRTVGINTGHVGTNDYNLEEEDRDFMVQRGYNATLSFLRYYAAKHPSAVKRKQKTEADEQLPSSNHAAATATYEEINGVISVEDISVDDDNTKLVPKQKDHGYEVVPVY